MSRYAVIAAMLVVALTPVAVVSGCGGGDDDNAAGDTNTATDSEQAAREAANRRIREEGRKRREARKRSRKPRTRAERAATVRRRRRAAAAQRRRDRAADRKADREFDRGFRESGFDKLVGRLPIRKPPLHVQQYITTTGSHRVYTAVDRRRFLCRMSRTQRQRAVASFFRAADRIMRAGGVDDFVQVVTVTSETTQSMPALAQARRGSVTLEGPARERNPC